ncbi:PepSY domain-containing protein [Steroidobacter denitrificans]|nr:PepSY domain-containing protein [Steroidobacter denitrificans]
MKTNASTPGLAAAPGPSPEVTGRKLRSPAACLLLCSMLALALSTGGTNSAVFAKDKEHDVIHDALRRGEVLSLAKILTIAERHVPGEVIEVELEDGKRAALIYEIKILTPTGRIREIEIDARTGKVLKIEDD